MLGSAAVPGDLEGLPQQWIPFHGVLRTRNRPSPTGQTFAEHCSWIEAAPGGASSPYRPDNIQQNNTNSMIPSRIIGKTTGDNWIGLIDATYAIILTLLVIELPAIILESIKEVTTRVHSVTALSYLIGVLIVGYFSVFTIVYDVWSYHKALLFDAVKLRLFALSTGWLLFVSSLIPPFYYLVNHYAADAILHAGESKALLICTRTFLLFLILVLYLLLAFLAKSEKRQQGQSPERKDDLEILYGTALSKAAITAVLMGTVDGILYLPPPLGVLILALCTYFRINFFTRQRRPAAGSGR
jgi:uncharacterized membrane protein